jgi:TRAP-type uncharacterized transport system substrate-binding protein
MRAALRHLFRVANPPDLAVKPDTRPRGLPRRLRIMAGHTWLMMTAAILLCGGAGAVAYLLANQPTELTIAVGPPGSEDIRVVQLIAAQLARDQSNIRLQINVVAGGPPEAAKALEDGQADLAVIRRDSGVPKNGQAIAILRKNVVVFVVPSAAKAAKGGKAATPAKGKPIEKIEQMPGRRLGIVGRSPRNLDLLKVILRQYNIDADKVVMLSPSDIAKPNEAGKISVVQFDPNNVASAIRDSNVDVIMSVGPVGSPITAAVVAAAMRGKEPPKFLAIDAAEAIAAREPIYEAEEIKAGAFGGSPQQPDEDVATIEVDHFIMARKTLGEHLAADFTKYLFAMRSSLAAELPSAAKIEKADTDKDAAVPAHPGAAAYIDGDLKSFFERYSDLLYWGLMLVSLFGSGLAGLLSYNKADDRVEKLRRLERLLEIAKAARKAESVAALDALQDEIDTIQGEMIQQVEVGALDETALLAYTMSTERAQSAISERRTLLPDLPGRPFAAVASL